MWTIPAAENRGVRDIALLAMVNVQFVILMKAA